jgi:hypothetical protein
LEELDGDASQKETRRDYVAEEYSSAGLWGLAFSFLFVLKMYVTGYRREKANRVGELPIT